MDYQTQHDQNRAQEAGVDLDRIPRHVAMIMDGNGRWANQQGQERIYGHQKGVETVRRATTLLGHLGVERLTLYAFSSENWQRPAQEVSFLWQLLQQYLAAELSTLMDNGVRLEVIGDIAQLPEECQQSLADTMAQTAQNDNITVCMALSYGGQDELVRAAQQLAREIVAGDLEPGAIDAHRFGQALDDATPVDLLVRTAGEQRISNFLLWQAAYAEFVSVDVCWPAMMDEDVFDILRTYQERNRTFGKLPGQVAKP